MKLYAVIFAATLILLFSSCEKVKDSGVLAGITNDTITTEEIIEGLKTALIIGTDSATTALNVVNGYYHGDEQFIKIPLPEEAENVRQLINNNNTLASLFDLDSKFENVVRSVNRAAETAAKDAGPIFGDAITSLSIDEAWDILNGQVPTSEKSESFDSTAATTYLKLQTFTSLTTTFSPYINDALGQDLGLGFSATQAWNTLTSAYNTTLNSSAVQLALTLAGNSIDMPDAIETNLGIFSTQKALDGLFFKVGEEEKKIRKNPLDWAVEIIQKVFDYIQDRFE